METTEPGCGCSGALSGVGIIAAVSALLLAIVSRLIA